MTNVPDIQAPASRLRRRLATSEHPAVKHLKRLYNLRRTFSLPAPRPIVRPLLWTFLCARGVCLFLKRVLFCEPLFKAYCETYGRRLRTGSHLHWVQGQGRIVIGDDVWVDGKSTFTFANRYADRPTLEIGDGSGIGHACTFVVGRRIAIGRRCMLSGQNLLFDSSGHATGVAARREGRPPPEEEVREIVIGDDVWIGVRAVICPGVRIGEGSVVSAGAVVHTHVPPHCVVAGNPARVMFRLRPPETQPSH